MYDAEFKKEIKSENINEINNQSAIDLEYDNLVDSIHLCNEHKYEQSSTLDKAVLTIAAGSFGITITFFKTMISDSVSNIWLLFLGWFLLVFCILITLFSFFFSQKSFNTHMDYLV